MKMPKAIDDMIERVLDTEGPGSNDPDDAGGLTMWGWTEATAAGYGVDVRTITRQTAKELYYEKFITNPGFDLLIPFSPAFAEELVDQAVNMGSGKPALFLQEWLNVLNNEGQLYPDIVEDGAIGKQTLQALEAYHLRRGDQGIDVLRCAINCSQGEYYKDRGRARPRNEKYMYGWLLNRVYLLGGRRV